MSYSLRLIKILDVIPAQKISSENSPYRRHLKPVGPDHKVDLLVFRCTFRFLWKIQREDGSIGNQYLTYKGRLALDDEKLFFHLNSTSTSKRRRILQKLGENEKEPRGWIELEPNNLKNVMKKLSEAI